MPLASASPPYVCQCAEGASSTVDLSISFSISITSDDIFYEVVTENNLVCTKKKASSYAGILFDHTLQNNCINQPCNSQYLLHSVNDTYFIYYIIIWTFIMNDCQWNIINIRETRACTITCTVELLTFVHSLYQGIKGNAITQFMILYWFALKSVSIKRFYRFWCTKLNTTLFNIGAFTLVLL